MRHFLLMIAVVALVGCGKKTTTDKVDVQPVNPSVGENKPEEQLKPPKVVPKKLITNPIVEAAIRKHLKKPTGELTKADLEKVTELNFNAGQITAEGLKEVAKLQKLETLALRSTGVTDAGLKEVAKCTQLTYLDLGNTKITDAGLKEVVKLKKLNDLTLAATKITGAGLKELAKMNQLRHLWLDETKVTKAGVAELQKALPKCSITGP